MLVVRAAHPEHAVQLGDYVLGRGEWVARPALPGLVNVIPYNPREGSPWEAPEESRVDQFLAWLGETGVYAKRRRTKPPAGDDENLRVLQARRHQGADIGFARTVLERGKELARLTANPPIIGAPPVVGQAVVSKG